MAENIFVKGSSMVYVPGKVNWQGKKVVLNNMVMHSTFFHWKYKIFSIYSYKNFQKNQEGKK